MQVSERVSAQVLPPVRTTPLGMMQNSGLQEVPQESAVPITVETRLIMWGLVFAQDHPLS